MCNFFRHGIYPKPRSRQINDCGGGVACGVDCRTPFFFQYTTSILHSHNNNNIICYSCIRVRVPSVRSSSSIQTQHTNIVYSVSSVGGGSENFSLGITHINIEMTLETPSYRESRVPYYSIYTTGREAWQKKYV